MVRLEWWSEKTEETKFFIRAWKRQNNALLKTIYQEGQPFLSINKSPGTFQNWGDFMQLRRIRIALFRSWSEPRCDLLNICIWSFFMLEERKKERKSMQKLPRKLSKICIHIGIFVLWDQDLNRNKTSWILHTAWDSVNQWKNATAPVRKMEPDE